MTAPANDNTARPTAYDAALVAYAPFARKCAARLAPDDDVEEVVQDFYVEACRRWAAYDPSYKFGTWVFQVVRNVAWTRRRYRRAEKRGSLTVSTEIDVRFENDGAASEDTVTRRALSVPANQHDYAELSQALAAMTGRGGAVLLRRAMGDTLQDLSGEMGVSRERVRQIEEGARAKLVRAGVAA